MPNHYYIMTDSVNNGTRLSGAYTSRQTTSFSSLGTSNYYPSLKAVVDGNTLLDGDEIIFANTHDYDPVANYTVTIVADVKMYTVLYTDLTTASTGAIEGTASSVYDVQVDGAVGVNLSMDGLSLRASDELRYGTNAHSQAISNQTLYLNGGSNDFIRFSGADGLYLKFKNLDINFDTAGQHIDLGNGARIEIDGGSINSTCNSLVQCKGVGGGCLSIKNYGFSAMTSGYIVDINGVADDNNSIELSRCKIDLSSVDLLNNGLIYHPGQTVDAWSIDNGNGYYYFEHHRYEGLVLESTNTYRSSGATYDGTNHFSAEFQSNSNIVPFTQPLRYKLAEIEIDLSIAKTLTAHILQQATIAPADFTDHECWIEITYPDATDNALGKTVSSQTTNILEAPITLNGSNQSWSNTTGNVTKNLMSVIVPASIAKAPVTVYLCVAKDISIADGNGADDIEIFACPKLEIS